MPHLGTSTAGIAHELNNPAAAVQRSTEHLDTVLFDSAHTFMRLVRQGLSPEQQTTLEQFVRRAQEQARVMPDLDPLARSDRATELEEWLEDRGLAAAWDCPSTLLNLPLTDDELA